MHRIFLALFLLFTLGSRAQTARLNHIALWVTNLKTSTTFYQSIIGLDTIPEPFHDGKHTWLSVGPQAALHLIEGAPLAEDRPKHTHLCFSVTSLEALAKRLDSAGIKWESWTGEIHTATLRTDGVHQIYFKDPDGYWVEVNDAKN